MTDAKNPIGTEITPQQALSILVQAVNFAQSKGIYSLEDAEIISKAVKCFVVKKDEAPQDVPGTTATEAKEVTPNT